MPGHPERPERLVAALKGLQDPPLDLVWPEITPATPSQIALAHTQAHVQGIQRVSEEGGGWLDADTFVVPASFAAASLAAGATIQSVADVVRGRQNNALVLVRPPGHHATRERAMGFCLFNNAAVAAEVARQDVGVRRLAIVDIDVHHGNGTQDIFYTDPDVMYCSTHQYPFYPGTGALGDVGGGEAVGTTVNLPLMAGCGDATYALMTERVLVPAMRRFEPECLIVSVGFDAHWMDPLASMRLSLDGYAVVLEQLLSLADEVCGGRVVMLLEGGYDLDVIENGVRALGHLLSGRSAPPDPLGHGTRRNEPVAVSDLCQAARSMHGLD